jgi:hypothetical protein
MTCTCGHAIEEHGHDPVNPGSMACTVCDCICEGIAPETPPEEPKVKASPEQALPKPKPKHGGARNSPPWPAERTAELHRLHAEKMPAARIAVMLGISRKAVLGKLFRLRRHVAAAANARHVDDAKDAAAARHIADAVRKAFPVKGDASVWGPTALLDLREGQCRWPLDHEVKRDPPFMTFCGRPAVKSLPSNSRLLSAYYAYCERHMAESIQKR